MSKNYAKSVLTSEQLEAIGCIAVESSALEDFVEWSIWRIAGIQEPTGTLFTGNLMLGSKITLMSKLIESRIGEEQYTKLFQKLIGDINHEIANRNTAIHGVWRLTSVTDIGNDSHGDPLFIPNSTAHKRLKNGRERIMSQSDCLLVADKLNALHGQLRSQLESCGLLQNSR